MIYLKKINKVFRTARESVHALRDINMEVKKGEFIVLKGPSGSGKTTLLMTIGAMLQPASGTVLINGNDIYSFNERERTRFRAKYIGFVFQEFYLIPYLNIIDNILLSAGIIRNGESLKKALDLSEQLGLSHRIFHRPYELSAGEQQRTALIRALIHDPQIILADEPTGNLDPENSEIVINVLENFHKKGGVVIMGSHRNDADRVADRVILMQNQGSIV